VGNEREKWEMKAKSGKRKRKVGNESEKWEMKGKSGK
jgi:hypothetical protein